MNSSGFAWQCLDAEFGRLKGGIAQTIKRKIAEWDTGSLFVRSWRMRSVPIQSCRPSGELCHDESAGFPTLGLGWLRGSRSKGANMRMKQVRLAIALASILSTASCIHFNFLHTGPPCMGNACPTGTGGQAPTVTAQVRAPEPVKTQTQTQTQVQPGTEAQVQSASGGADAAPAAADAAAQVAPAPANDAQGSAQPVDASAAAPAASATEAQSAQANNSQPGAKQQKPGLFTRALTVLHLHSKS